MAIWSANRSLTRKARRRSAVTRRRDEFRRATPRSTRSPIQSSIPVLYRFDRIGRSGGDLRGGEVLGSLSSVLVLIGVAFFLALGLEPAASWFVNHILPRWAATTLVFAIFLALMGAFVAAAIPPLAEQASELIRQAPHYLQQAQDHSSAIGKLNDRFHLQQRITDTVNGSGGSVVSDVVNAGSAVVRRGGRLLVVIVLTVYFLVDMPRIRTNLYRWCPTPVGPAPSSSEMKCSPRSAPTCWATC